MVAAISQKDIICVLYIGKSYTYFIIIVLLFVYYKTHKHFKYYFVSCPYSTHAGERVSIQNIHRVDQIWMLSHFLVNLITNIDITYYTVVCLLEP